MTTLERIELRQRLAKLVMDWQQLYLDHTPEEMIPEFIAALLSISANIAKNNAGLSPIDFITVCIAAISEEWKTPDNG